MKPLSFAKVKIGIVDWFYFRRKLCNKLMSIASFCIIIPSIHIISRFGFRMLDVCLSICKHSKHILSSADYFMHFLCVLLEKFCAEKICGTEANKRKRANENRWKTSKKVCSASLTLALAGSCFASLFYFFSSFFLSLSLSVVASFSMFTLKLSVQLAKTFQYIIFYSSAPVSLFLEYYFVLSRYFAPFFRLYHRKDMIWEYFCWLVKNNC